jgi:hypothetical protein
MLAPEKMRRYLTIKNAIIFIAAVIALNLFVKLLITRPVSLTYDGQSFTPIAFENKYREGSRYIGIRGMVDYVEGDYIFDLQEEMLYSLEDNKHLLDSNYLYTIEVFLDNEWTAYDTIEYARGILADISIEPLLLRITDSDGNYLYEFEISALDGFYDTEHIYMDVSYTGKYLYIRFENNKYLVDLLDKQVIIPPSDFSKTAFRLSDNDKIALLDEKVIWHIEEDKVVTLNYDTGLNDPFVKLSSNGKYLYWSHDHQIWSVDTTTSETILAFDSKDITGPDFDMNDIHWLYDREVAAVGHKNRAWYDFGVLPGSNDLYIMKYNNETQRLEREKFSTFRNRINEGIAFSCDESAAYYIKGDRMYKLAL